MRYSVSSLNQEISWLYKIKYLPDNQIDKYKASLLGKGFTTMANMDYFKTFAPAAKLTIFRLILTLAAMHNWSITWTSQTLFFMEFLMKSFT